MIGVNYWYMIFCRFTESFAFLVTGLWGSVQPMSFMPTFSQERAASRVDFSQSQGAWGASMDPKQGKDLPTLKFQTC